tara:strand:+ start:13047 stop:13166 length:120 start_codon:yes stop_codon:yes gene_type:complete
MWEQTFSAVMPFLHRSTARWDTLFFMDNMSGATIANDIG